MGCLYGRALWVPCPHLTQELMAQSWHMVSLLPKHVSPDWVSTKMVLFGSLGLHSPLRKWLHIRIQGTSCSWEAQSTAVFGGPWGIHTCDFPKALYRSSWESCSLAMNNLSLLERNQGTTDSGNLAYHNKHRDWSEVRLLPTYTMKSGHAGPDMYNLTPIISSVLNSF